jgi:hypothetical protein
VTAAGFAFQNGSGTPPFGEGDFLLSLNGKVDNEVLRLGSANIFDKTHIPLASDQDDGP